MEFKANDIWSIIFKLCHETNLNKLVLVFHCSVRIPSLCVPGLCEIANSASKINLLNPSMVDERRSSSSYEDNETRNPSMVDERRSSSSYEDNETRNWIVSVTGNRPAVGCS